ncbi:serine/threonine-protein kinase [Actinokineospora enzanensis]|uniref:serine/threonine-protein kinase n=1 Tax=Actinokineospora enzanensis TaxID=155975 RepID=UPI00035E29C9|nr:serine/threonine-protein kinase [Actinokineospora enzanensis]
MTVCGRNGCPGTIGRSGFCGTCGFPPQDTTAEPPPADDPPVLLPGRVTSTIATRAQQTTGQGTGDVGVPLPEVELPDLDGLVLADPTVPPEDRFCGKQGCGARVGRSIGGGSAPLEGHCAECGSRFSFRPKLKPGDVVAGRYEVRGCVARGGLGFVYLGNDVRLGVPVAIKGLIDTNNTAATRLAENESQVLIALEHQNIVRIFDVVTHEDARYIVMEFVNGLSLRELLVREDRLLVEHVVGYGREILTALSYLHNQDLLYCDMKPDNVIHGDRRVKLIDFGAIRRVGDHDSVLVGTDRYQVGPEEIAHHGLTVRSDIHTVGVTLGDLFAASDGARAGGHHPAAFGIESFRHVLARATAPYERRYASADEMLVQLDGVLNEIRGLREGKSFPMFSTLFAEPTVLLDAGLGHAPPLARWTGEQTTLDTRPTPHEIATALPAPREDPGDERISFLRTVRAPDAARLLRKLDGTSSVEVEFRRCRALLELSRIDEARQAVAEAARLLADKAAHDWRVQWHHGLVALADGRTDAARTHFDRVYRDLPGEETPKLALGFCAEHLDAADPAPYYRALWVNHNQVNAAFGLARAALARGDRAAAFAVLDEVPASSRHDEAARIAGIRVLSEPLPSASGVSLPSEDDLTEAAGLLAKLRLDRVREARLTAVLLETALSRMEAGFAPGAVLDDPTERCLRSRLEETLRALATWAPRAAEHGVLTDLANRHRPVTWF